MSDQTPRWLGSICPIPPERCPKKVWKHLYDHRERWDRLCDGDIAAMRAEAELIVKQARASTEELPHLPERQKTRVSELLIAHHETVYAPTYMSELAEVETVWTPNMNAEHRHFALTPRSIFVVVQLEQPVPWVVTAFRPHPAHSTLITDEQDLQQYGRDYFERRTLMSVEELASTTARHLARFTEPPQTMMALWSLAAAVGYGRLLQHMPAVQQVLQPAEDALGQTPPALVQALRQGFAWDELLDQLSGALQETRPEEFEHVLTSAEELLLVAESVGDAQAAAAFADEAQCLVAWMPPEWSHLGDQARWRAQVFGASAAPAGLLWQTVEEASVEALMRDATPTIRPAARLVDALFGAPASQPVWKERLDGLVRSLGVSADNAIASLKGWLDDMIGEVSLAPLAPAMGSAESQAQEWVVRGRLVPDAPETFRAFIVDADSPEGYEVTEALTYAEDLWSMASHERACLVIIAADAPLKGQSMAEVFEGASGIAGVAVRVRELQPTQTTKASR